MSGIMSVRNEERVFLSEGVISGKGSPYWTTLELFFF
jgi:hypothetical protein